MKEILVRIYSDQEGREPFTEWLRKLELTERAMIRKRIARIRNGNLGDFKRITGAKGLFELRIHFGAGYRIYFAKDGDAIVIFLSGGMKKSQLRDIAKARNYLEEYLNRE